MNTTLKRTLVTTVLAFSAGAACAGSIAAFSFRDTLSPEDFLQRVDVLLVEVADIGAHVAGTRDAARRRLPAFRRRIPRCRRAAYPSHS